MADINYLETKTTGADFASHNSFAMSTYAPEMSLGALDFSEFNDWNENAMFNEHLYHNFSEFDEDYGNLQNPMFVSKETVVDSAGISTSSKFLDDGVINGNRGSGKEKKEIRNKVAFRTKSQVEILDDGYKWRKYGKKMVKNSPNPRNYFKCSIEGCPVKKRAERDKDDPHFVVTTYEGIHSHQGNLNMILNHG